MSYLKVNGVKLFYQLKGNQESKNTLVFLNGVMASTGSWENQYRFFEKMDFKILLHDFRGQLMSDKPEGEYSFQQHADDLIGLMDELKIEKAHLIGTSYGGEVAMKTAVLYPERVNTVSVIDSVSELDELLIQSIYLWKILAKQGDAEAFYRGMIPSIYGNVFVEQNKENLEKKALEMKSLSKDYLSGQISLYNTFLNDVDMTEELERIKAPLLVVCGQEDTLKRPKFSKIIADKVKNSEYALIPDCGHVTIYEKPDVLNSLLLGFILKNSFFNNKQ